MPEALCERGQAAGHGWTLDTELLPPHQQQVNALESQGLVELAGREDRAKLSALEGRPVRWAARLTLYGHDTLTFGCCRPRAEPPPRRLLKIFCVLAPERQVRGQSCEHAGGMGRGV
ncbi:hypothetical protein ACH40F_57740, partial [Streptomyces sp. NPDC020794]|uniref:hypothetical protein n=1 Tax=unclassified Streptomyces TaxID=2593676 RepID=UPI0036EB7944